MGVASCLLPSRRRGDRGYSLSIRASHGGQLRHTAWTRRGALTIRRPLKNAFFAARFVPSRLFFAQQTAASIQARLHRPVRTLNVRQAPRCETTPQLGDLRWPCAILVLYIHLLARYNNFAYNLRLFILAYQAKFSPSWPFPSFIAAFRFPILASYLAYPFSKSVYKTAP